MTLTTTFRLLRKAGACETRYKALRKSLRGVKDAEPINLLTILEVLNLDDALWALRATKENCDKVARLMAADFAEEVLPLWHKRYPSDTRPAEAIQAARDFANGAITQEQLDAARGAAWDAAWTAWDERDAAGAATWAAAWDAARAKQKAIFISYLQPDSLGEKVLERDSVPPPY